MSNPKATTRKSSPPSKAFKTLGVFILAAVSPLQAKAGDCRIETQAVLPIVFDGFLPTVKAQINGIEVTMGIDTGAQGTIITPETARILHLPKPTGKQIKKVRVRTFDFAGIGIKQVNLPVIPLPVGHLPNHRLAGLIGANILANYDLDYDPLHRRIILYNVENCSLIRPPWQDPYTRVPVTITASHRMAVPVMLNGYPVTAIFDTGSSGLRLASSAIAHAGLTREDLAQDPVMGVRGAGSLRKARLHHFSQIRIGNEIFLGPHILIVRFPSKEADMLLGENYMRKRRFWISYATSTLFIQKAQQP